MNIRVVLKEIVTLVWLWLANDLTIGACLLKSLSVPKFTKSFHGRLVDLVHNSLSLFNLDQLSEVPSELFRDVEVKVNILHIDLAIVHDA